MLKQTITFKDLDGNEVTEDFYFNLSTVELAELELSEEGFSDKLLAIINTENTTKIFQMFRTILTKAIGKRSEDGRRFIKNQDVIDEFFQSNAYEVLFLQWIEDANKAAEFINAVLPADLEQVTSEIAARQQARKVEDVHLPEEPAWVREGRVPTPKELEGATTAQLQEAFRRQAERKPDTAVTTG